MADYTYELGAIVKVVGAHNKALHFKSAKFNGFNFGADYFFGDQNKTNSDGSKHTDVGRGFNLVAFYETKFGDISFKVEGGYGELRMKDTKIMTKEINCRSSDGTIILADGTVIRSLDNSASCNRMVSKPVNISKNAMG
ncbi:hypothetical protein BKG89_01465 [Rodentibacter caecimuris]|uniref:Porin domain-containing protein n=1 Tax=Rodentibacter caecimuris TaxID=1796644 RepID=A0ABX3KZZ4_9PAST|nr:hypothetical protein BKG89_01465 [Rodentibacter heylii]